MVRLVFAMILLVSIRATTSLLAKNIRPFASSLRGGATKLSPGSESWYEPSLMDHMLYRIQECNQIPDRIQQSLLDFTVDGKVLGKVSCLRVYIDVAFGPAKPH